MKQRKPYKTYTREFKQEAVRLMETTDRPATEVAMELGIRRNQLYKWKEQLAVKGDAAFSGGGRPRTVNLSELALLRRENEQLREENDGLCGEWNELESKFNRRYRPEAMELNFSKAVSAAEQAQLNAISCLADLGRPGY